MIKKILPSFLSKRIILLGKQTKKYLKDKKTFFLYGDGTPFLHSIKLNNTSFKIILDPINNHTVDMWIARNGNWEPSVSKALIENMPKDGIFLDIGANIGYHSLFMASYSKGQEKIYTFEPIKRLHHQLEKSIAVNNFSNITSYNIALGDCDRDSQTIYIREENIGGSSLLIYPNLEYVNVKETEKVNIRSLDKFFKEDFKVNLIKIDVEGYEYEVLKGGSKLLENNHPTLVIEFSPYFYVQDYANKPFDLIFFLENLGYSFFTLLEEPLDLLLWMKENKSNSSQVDILCKVI